MKLKLNKKNLKNLSKDNQILPADMTPQVAGGTDTFIVSGGACFLPRVTEGTCGGGSIGSCGCDSLPAEGNCNTNTCW